MKKIAFGIAFLFLFSSLTFGQNRFRFGFQLSPNFTWMKSDDNKINGNGSNLGFKLGMLGEKYFTERENYALVFGLGFAFNQGGTLRHDVGGDFWSKSDLSREDLHFLPDGINLKYGIQYIEIPIALKMRTQEFGYFRYFVEPGFTIGIKTQARGDISGDANFAAEQENISKDVNFLSLSWGIGGGVEYSLGENTALVGGIFFQNGFVDATDDAAFKRLDNLEMQSEDSRGTINSITIRLGVMF